MNAVSSESEVDVTQPDSTNNSILPRSTHGFLLTSILKSLLQTTIL